MSKAPQRAARRCHRQLADPDAASWVCWQCLCDLAGPHPRMPLYALANDNWIGRERLEVREASEATRWLSCLGRCCWKQVRLGHGSPELQQKGITGNTIFLPQDLLLGRRSRSCASPTGNHQLDMVAGSLVAHSRHRALANKP